MDASRSTAEAGQPSYRDVYLTQVDRDLGLDSVNPKPYTRDDVHAFLVLYSLLYERLIVPDVSTLYNDAFQEVIRDPRHELVELLREGVVVPTARDVAPTFVELEEQLRAANTWRAPAAEVARPWAEYLDENVRQTHAADINLAAAGDAFTKLVEGAVSDPEKADRLGLGGARDELLEFLDGREDEHLRRSSLYEFADQRVDSDPQAGRQARLLGSTVYYMNAATFLGVECAMAGPYARTYGGLHDVSDELEAGMSASRQVLHTAERTTREFSFAPIELARLDYATIAAVRESSEFRRYLDDVSAAKADPDETRGARLATHALTEYLEFLSERLLLERTGRSAELRRMQRVSKLVHRTMLAGGAVALPALGLVVPGAEYPAVAGGLFWAIGAETANARMNKHVEKVVRRAKADASQRSQEHGGARDLRHRT